MSNSHGKNFQTAIWIIFILMAFAPWIMGGYLVLQAHVNVVFVLVALAVFTLLIVFPGFFLVRRFIRQLRSLIESTGAVGAGKAGQPLVVDESAPNELYELAGHFNTLLREVDRHKRNFREVTDRMLAYTNELDTYKQKLKEESILRAYLARYVGEDVVEQMILSHKEDPLKNERCEATLLFADIRSFTTISERMNPEEIISMLNEYFDAMVDIIFKHGGILDKFVGDELMAVFRQRPDKAEGPMNAVSAAVGMRKRLRDLMQERNSRGKQVFEVGIGVNTGQVVMGNVGAKNRLDYTVIGDTVNVAARLEQMAEGQEIIVGEDTWQYCREHIPMREKGEITVKNRALPVKCYEVLIR